MPSPQLIVLGASARAACFSAHRSGYAPYWIDRYGDHDLTEKFAGTCISADAYPRAMLEVIAGAPPVPFIYTGAMENHLAVLQALGKVRPLLGNSTQICRAVRDPERIAACFHHAGIHHPQQICHPVPPPPGDTGWLIKPLRSAGGFGVKHYTGERNVVSGVHYLQEYIHGSSQAGIYLGDGRAARLLGVTRQLVGEAFLHAGEFSYCGSIGPLSPDAGEEEQWLRIGHALTTEFGLRGIFGVDAINQAGDIYPLEVNPRYTASVELLELALGLPVIAIHCDAARGKLPAPAAPGVKSIIAKACLFAGRKLQAPAYTEQLVAGSGDLPLTADIPRAQSLIGEGQPIMTILAQAENLEQGMQILVRQAEWLYDKFLPVE